MVPSPLFIFASSVLCLISTLTEEGKDGHLFRVTCSVVLCGGRDSVNKFHWYLWGVFAVSGPCWVCPSPRLCASQIYNAQAPWSSARTLSQVGPAFYALPRSKPLSFSGSPQGHRLGWAVCSVPSPGPSSSGDQVLGECTVPGGPCVLITSQVPGARVPSGPARVPSHMHCMSPLGS